MKAQNTEETTWSDTFQDGFSRVYGFFAPVVTAVCNGMGAVVGIEPVEGEDEVSQQRLKK